MSKTKGAVSKGHEISAEELREILKPIYKKLQAKGVDGENLPDNQEVIEKLIGFIEGEKIDEYIDKYSEWIKTKP